jgi:nitrous oxidase accessory protein
VKRASTEIRENKPLKRFPWASAAASHRAEAAMLLTIGLAAHTLHRTKAAVLMGRGLGWAVAVLLILVWLPASAATWIVQDSITETAAKASTGDTLVIIGPKIFHEHVTISKPLRLIGTNAPVISAEGKGTPLTVTANSAQVFGISIRDGGNDLGAFDSGIMVTASDVTVSRCRVAGGGFGIYLRGVSDCCVENNTIMGNSGVPASQRGNGIHLWKSKGSRITGNVISGTRDGAYFSYADGNLIASNRIENTRFGIHYMYSNENRLLENYLTGNAVGAALMFARKCQVEGNRAVANRRHGILLKQVEHSHFIRNSVYGQNRGFFIQQAAQDRFEDNLIANNDIGLYLSNGSEQNVFIGNAFVQNVDQVWQPQDEKEMGRLASNRFNEKRRGNFWSDYTGTDANGDGIGDTPYHETDLYGYVVDHHPEARVFALSPAVALLRKSEELVPLLDTQGITDAYPLAQIPSRLALLLIDLKAMASPAKSAAAASAQGLGTPLSQTLSMK